MRNAITMLTTVFAYLLVIAITLSLIPASFEISRWEQHHKFPFGKMCNSIFTLWEDTCP